MTLDFQTQVLEELSQLRSEVASLGRAVRGAPAEGNIGIQAQIGELRVRGDQRHDDIEVRLVRMERLELRLRGWVATAAGVGAALGATLALVLDLRRWFGA